MIPSGLSLSPHAWTWLVPAALVLAALAVWAYRRIAPSLKGSARSLLTGLRAAVLVLVAFLLARPLLSLAGDAAGKGVVVLLTDVSRSMDLPADSTGGAGVSVSPKMGGWKWTSLSIDPPGNGL